jgi:glyoxylase-like metal-dependent hydrolase (beta-lactamase superfamily II)
MSGDNVTYDPATHGHRTWGEERSPAVNRQQLQQPVICLSLVVLLLAGCGGVQAEPTAVPTSVPPTPTPTSTTEAPTLVPPTPTPRSTTAGDSHYRFTLGDYKCVCLYDGIYNYGLSEKFAGVPREEVQEALRQHDLPTESARSPYTFLYVNTGEHQVLVDLGNGEGVPNAGRLDRSLEAAGIEPEEIDTVIITHAHPDHIGGTLDADDNLVFARASYYLSKEEWDFWFSESTMDLVPKWHVRLARKSLEALQDRITLLEGEAEIVPGIRAIPAPGHTPGHMVVAVSSGDEQLLYIGDTATHILHLEHRDWRPSYDILPEEAIASQRQILDLATAEGALVVATHFFPFPSLGTVVQKGEGWQWQPIATTE